MRPVLLKASEPISFTEAGRFSSPVRPVRRKAEEPMAVRVSGHSRAVKASHP